MFLLIYVLQSPQQPRMTLLKTNQVKSLPSLNPSNDFPLCLDWNSYPYPCTTSHYVNWPPLPLNPDQINYNHFAPLQLWKASWSLLEYTVPILMIGLFHSLPLPRTFCSHPYMAGWFELIIKELIQRSLLRWIKRYFPITFKEHIILWYQKWYSIFYMVATCIMRFTLCENTK